MGLEIRGIGSTPYIDFSKDASIDYDARLILEDINTLKLDGASFKIVDGTQGAGKVLTSDATGKATWQEAAGISSCRLCFKWTVTAGGDNSQCNKLNTGTQCAAVDAWTTGYLDSTDERAGGCILQWKLDCTAPYGD
jgi:hypothetical protein